MAYFIKRFKDLFKNSEELEKEKEDTRIEEKKRLDALHKEARKPFKKTKLTIEDFEKAEQTKKKPKKPVSYTF